MPTPFMHIAFAQRMIVDPVLPLEVKSALEADWGAFLLGSIAPDARVSSGIERADTHFFEYKPVVEPSAIEQMMNEFPELSRANVTDPTRAAFVAGYAGHLMMDQVWCTDFLFPVFYRGTWENHKAGFNGLHYLLTHLDHVDHATLSKDVYAPLANAQPQKWLPFVPDKALIEWRDIVASQLAPDGHNRTAEILGSRISLTEADVMTALGSTDEMQRLVWNHVPQEALSQVQESMYHHTRDAIVAYYC